MNATQATESESLTPAELLAHRVSSRAQDAAEVLMQRAQYTTTALEALAVFHAQNDDVAGAALLREFAARFAAHEVTTL
jgi:hypothetical protein